MSLGVKKGDKRFRLLEKGHRLKEGIGQGGKSTCSTFKRGRNRNSYKEGGG